MNCKFFVRNTLFAVVTSLVTFIHCRLMRMKKRKGKMVLIDSHKSCRAKNVRYFEGRVFFSLVGNESICQCIRVYHMVQVRFDNDESQKCLVFMCRK